MLATARNIIEPSRRPGFGNIFIMQEIVELLVGGNNFLFDRVGVRLGQLISIRALNRIRHVSYGSQKMLFFTSVTIISWAWGNTRSIKILG